MAHSACRALIAACALLLCAEALHQHRPRRFPRRPRALRKGVPKGENGVKIFTKAWQRKFSAENETGGLAKPLPESIVVVLGVMTQTGDEPFRAVIRDTWMRHPSVCGIEVAPKAKCAVHAGFVFGQPIAASGPNATGGSFVRDGDVYLDMSGPDRGKYGAHLAEKTFLFFQYASATFPWATHIVRLDTDFYPHFDLMLLSIQEFDAKGNPMQFLGGPMGNFYCGANVSDIEAGRAPGRNYCTQGCYMAMSRPLARALCGNLGDYFDPIFNSYKGIPDDIGMGYTFSKFVRDTGTPVTVAAHWPAWWDHAKY